MPKSHKRMVDIIEDVTSDEILKDQELEKDTETGTEVKSEDADMDSKEVETDKVEVDEAEADMDSDIANKDIAAASAGIKQATPPLASGKQELMNQMMKKVAMMDEEELVTLAKSFETQPEPAEVKTSEDDIATSVAAVGRAEAPKSTVQEEEGEETPEHEAGETAEFEAGEKEEGDVDEENGECNCDGECKCNASGEEEMTDEVKIDMEEDVKALVSAEANLTEAFKSKAKTIFESAVMTKIREEKTKLKEGFKASLVKQTEVIKSALVEKVDNYLTYVVENWMKENKVALATSLRVEVAENFITSLKSVFSEHYIEVPAGKTNVVEELNTKVSKLQEQLNASEKNRLALKSTAEKLQRQSILAEASKGLASTQAARLNELTKDVAFETSDSFQKKVTTIKESYFQTKSATAATAKVAAVTGNKMTQVIVEGQEDPNAFITSDMKNYLSAISRVEKNNPSK